MANCAIFGNSSGFGGVGVVREMTGLAETGDDAEGYMSMKRPLITRLPDEPD
jgi:hypothetical protein